jgi:hypothetical protein
VTVSVAVTVSLSVTVTFRTPDSVEPLPPLCVSGSEIGITTSSGGGENVGSSLLLVDTGALVDAVGGRGRGGLNVTIMVCVTVGRRLAVSVLIFVWGSSGCGWSGASVWVLTGADTDVDAGAVVAVADKVLLSESGRPRILLAASSS